MRARLSVALIAALTVGAALLPTTSAGAAPDGSLAASPAVTRVGPVAVTPNGPCVPPAAATQPQALVTTTTSNGGTNVPGPTARVAVNADGTWSAVLQMAGSGHFTVAASCLASPQAEGTYFTYTPTSLTVVTASVGYSVAGDLVTSADGFGDAQGVSLPALLPQSVAPIVGIAGYEPTGLGYWTVAADGGVFTFGDAPFVGSAGSLRLAAPVVGMAATRSGNGYWLLGRDGGVFTFGDAPFFGSARGLDPSPAVGIARTGLHTHPGYLVAFADGTVVRFDGTGVTTASPAIVGLAAPVVGIASTPSEMGWYLVGRDGGVFTSGDAVFAGSLPSSHLHATVVGITARFDGGYWLAGADLGVFSFGGAPFLGALAGTAHAGFGTAVGIAATADPLSPLR